jgi:hypothetical protein
MLNAEGVLDPKGVSNQTKYPLAGGLSLHGLPFEKERS